VWLGAFFFITLPWSPSRIGNNPPTHPPIGLLDRNLRVYIAYMNCLSENDCWQRPEALFPKPKLAACQEFLSSMQLVTISQENYCISTATTSRLLRFKETVAIYCENHTEHTNILCVQKTHSVPHRKHITSPLQSPTA
jgi:hypothetical protein